jgi:hypothetical protein
LPSDADGVRIIPLLKEDWIGWTTLGLEKQDWQAVHINTASCCPDL